MPDVYGYRSNEQLSLTELRARLQAFAERGWEKAITLDNVTGSTTVKVARRGETMPRPVEESSMQLSKIRIDSVSKPECEMFERFETYFAAPDPSTWQYATVGVTANMTLAGKDGSSLRCEVHRETLKMNQLLYVKLRIYDRNQPSRKDFPWQWHAEAWSRVLKYLPVDVEVENASDFFTLQSQSGAVLSTFDWWESLEGQVSNPGGFATDRWSARGTDLFAAVERMREEMDGVFRDDELTFVAYNYKLPGSPADIGNRIWKDVYASGIPRGEITVWGDSIIRTWADLERLTSSRGKRSMFVEIGTLALPRERLAVDLFVRVVKGSCYLEVHGIRLEPDIVRSIGSELQLTFPDVPDYVG